MAKLIDLLGCREITLKGDTELAIIAFRNRVADMCKAEVTTEDAVKGDKESTVLIENAVMLIRGIIRIIKCYIESSTQEPLSNESPILPWLVEHAGCILSRCQRKTPFERLHGNTDLHRSHGQNELQILVGDMAWNAKQQCGMFHWECRCCI